MLPVAHRAHYCALTVRNKETARLKGIAVSTGNKDCSRYGAKRHAKDGACQTRIGNRSLIGNSTLTENSGGYDEEFLPFFPSLIPSISWF